MALSAELNIEIGGFVSGIKQGQQVLKGLNAEMKASEAEFKATGNAEQKLTSQTNTLNSQIRVQKGVADQARQALDAMTKAGIKPADQEYQKLYVTLMNAEAGANEAQAALNQLGSGAAQAATGADKMANSLGNISKKLSLDQVLSVSGKTLLTQLQNEVWSYVSSRHGDMLWDLSYDILYSLELEDYSYTVKDGQILILFTSGHITRKEAGILEIPIDLYLGQ